jgi:agmatine deiminase
MIPDWETNIVYFSNLLSKRHPKLWERLSKIIRIQGIQIILLENTKDIWARDFCPIQIDTKQFIKFKYYPDYLRGKFEHLITDDVFCQQVDSFDHIRFSKIILDGGNVVSANNKVIVTNKIFKDNPSGLRSKLARLLGLENLIEIPVEPFDPIGHSDGLVRFLEEGLVVINDYSQVDPAYDERLYAALAKHNLHIERLPYFLEDRSKDGIPSAVGNYVNFLRIGNLIIVPAYKARQDDLACKTLERLCPQATVVPLECTDLAQEGGILNCISWTVKQ